MEIDAGRQRAAVANLESVRAEREADVQWARQQKERARRLLEAGAMSQAELEQAENALATSQAQLQAVAAQIRQQRLELGYYRVTAPVRGVVGDIRVRVGDSVTRSTVLTTIDQSGGLEVYVNVPVQQAGQLRPGLTVHLLDDEGATLATVSLTFVAPAVDEATQSVLAKAALAETAAFRPDQYVRARIVWSDAPGLTVPVVAVNRIGGQYFAFVVETEKGATVARQRAVELGPIVGNDYLLRSGLRAGEQLIVAGVQKVGDGAPVKAGPPADAPARSPAAGTSGREGG
jgi:RND family efflux transporter MFP subunit